MKDSHEKKGMILFSFCSNFVKKIFLIYKILMFLNFVELCIKCTNDMITIIFVEQDFHQFLFNCNVFWGGFFCGFVNCSFLCDFYTLYV